MSKQTPASSRSQVARQMLGIYLKGVAMGAADSIPGVSGGTIAFITGIYERLITAIAELDPRALLHLARVHTPEGRARFRKSLIELDVPFLVTLGAGVLTAIVLVSRVMYYALHAMRALTFAFFFGLIGASALVLFEHLTVDTPGRIASALLGFCLAFVVSGVTAGTQDSHALVIVFLAGAIAITAMILPGVSGAFFLVLLGQYDYIVGVLKRFVDQLIGFVLGETPIGAVIESGVTLVVFSCGAAVGLVGFARAIRWALSTYRAETIAFLIALMVGSLRLPATEILAHTTTWNVPTAIGTVLSVGIGAGGVIVLDHYTESLSY